MANFGSASRRACSSADEILFVVDAMNGVTDLDDSVAQILRRSKKPVILVANKVDSNDWLIDQIEIKSVFIVSGIDAVAGSACYICDDMTVLPYKSMYSVSAVSGFGTGDLLDEVVKKLPEVDSDEQARLEALPKFAIVGRPGYASSAPLSHTAPDTRSCRRKSLYPCVP